MIIAQVKTIMNLNFTSEYIVREWPVVFRYIICDEKFLISINILLINFDNGFVYQTSHVFSFTMVLYEASIMIADNR